MGSSEVRSCEERRCQRGHHSLGNTDRLLDEGRASAKHIDPVNARTCRVRPSHHTMVGRRICDPAAAPHPPAAGKRSLVACLPATSCRMMPAMKLFYTPTSPFVRKVLVAAQE